MKTAKELTTIAMNATFVNAERDKEDILNFIESLSDKIEEVANTGEFSYFIRFSELPKMRTKNAVALLRECLETYGLEVKKLDDRIKISWMAI